jgi:hypothetical protein
MGLTHDYRDVARHRHGPLRRLVAEPGIPHLLRRRARWFGARLRHTARD